MLYRHEGENGVHLFRFGLGDMGVSSLEGGERDHEPASCGRCGKQSAGKETKEEVGCEVGMRGRRDNLCTMVEVAYVPRSRSPAMQTSGLGRAIKGPLDPLVYQSQFFSVQTASFTLGFHDNIRDNNGGKTRHTDEVGQPFPKRPSRK